MLVFNSSIVPICVAYNLVALHQLHVLSPCQYLLVPHRLTQTIKLGDIQAGLLDRLRCRLCISHVCSKVGLGSTGEVEPRDPYWKRALTGIQAPVASSSLLLLLYLFNITGRLTMYNVRVQHLTVSTPTGINKHETIEQSSAFYYAN